MSPIEPSYSGLILKLVISNRSNSNAEPSRLSELADALVLQGYRRELQVEGRGEFSIRGGILDVFPNKCISNRLTFGVTESTV